MSITAAYEYEEGEKPPKINELPLQGHFTDSATAVRKQLSIPDDIDITSAANDGEFDALFLDPYAVTTRKRVFEKLERGEWGEALDILEQRLEGIDSEHAYDFLDKLFDDLNKHGFQDFTDQILLSLADLGLDIEFFNTSHNSSGSVPEPDVSTNRYPIHRHFENEQHKPQQFVQPWLGLSYG